jgi:hypothetical protein
VLVDFLRNAWASRRRFCGDRKTTAFLFGAGASRGSLDPFVAPVSKEFGKVLSAECPRWRTDYPAILTAVEHLRLDQADWALEPVWSCIDWYAKLQGALPLGRPWVNEGPQIKKALLEVYGTRCDAAAARVDRDSTIAKIFREEMSSGDVLVSFNYDTIAEHVAEREGKTLWSSPPGGRGIKFAKPHGSTSWTMDLRSGTVTWKSPAGRPLLASLSALDVDCSREPLLLGAVPIKSELIKEVQARIPAVFDVIIGQWRTVVEAMRDAATIVVVGYSFPSEDVYGRFLIQEGLRLRRRRGDLRVEFFELDRFSRDRKEEIKKVFRGYLRGAPKHRGPVRSSAVC